MTKWHFLLLCVLSGSVAFLRAQRDTITEFPITQGCCPNGIASGPDGALWFTAGYVIGRVTTTGSFSYDQVPFAPQGAITVGPDNALWFTGSNAGVGMIGRMTTDGQVSEYPTTTVNSFPQAIVPGPDGALWFTESGANKIGRITIAGSITEFPIPTPFSFPIGIAAGSDGALWFTESVANQIGRITVTGDIQEFALTGGLASPNWITAGPDGALWFTELSLPAGMIGRITTAGAVSAFLLSPEGATGQITAGPDGALWFTGGVFNSVGRITTTGVVTEYPLLTPSSYPTGITTGPDSALWLVENDGEKVARATACGIGVNLTATGNTLTVSFDASVTTPAVWRAWLVNGADAKELFEVPTKPLVPPRAVTLTLTNYWGQNNVEVSSTLSGSGGIICSDGQLLDAQPHP